MQISCLCTVFSLSLCRRLTLSLELSLAACVFKQFGEGSLAKCWTQPASGLVAPCRRCTLQAFSTGTAKYHILSTTAIAWPAESCDCCARILLASFNHVQKNNCMPAAVPAAPAIVLTRPTCTDKCHKGQALFEQLKAVPQPRQSFGGILQFLKQPLQTSRWLLMKRGTPAQCKPAGLSDQKLVI